MSQLLWLLRKGLLCAERALQGSIAPAAKGKILAIETVTVACLDLVMVTMRKYKTSSQEMARGRRSGHRECRHERPMPMPPAISDNENNNRTLCIPLVVSPDLSQKGPDFLGTLREPFSIMGLNGSSWEVAFQIPFELLGSQTKSSSHPRGQEKAARRSGGLEGRSLAPFGMKSY